MGASMGEVVMWSIIAGVPLSLMGLAAVAALVEEHRIRSRRKRFDSWSVN